MKTFFSSCLKMSAIMLAVGALLCVIGIGTGAISGFKNMVDNSDFVFNNWDHNAEFYDGKEDSNEVEYDKEDTYQASEVQSLTIDASYGEVYITSNDGSDIIIEAQNVSGSYKTSQNNGVLSIVEDREEGKFGWGIFDGVHHSILHISIPKGMNFNQVTLQIGAGKMDIEDMQAEQLSVDIGAGDFSGNAVHITKESNLKIGTGELTLDAVLHNIALDCGAGKADLSGTLTGDIDLTCSVGAVNFKTRGKESDFNYDIKCGVGDVRIGNNDYSGLSNSKNLDNNADQNLTIDCGVGNVTVEFDN